MNKINKTVNAEIELTPEEIADIFSNMSSIEQAKFFNRLAKLVKEWSTHAGGFNMQMEWVRREKELTKEGRDIMKIIGEK